MSTLQAPLAWPVGKAAREALKSHPIGSHGHIRLPGGGWPVTSDTPPPIAPESPTEPHWPKTAKIDLEEHDDYYEAP